MAPDVILSPNHRARSAVALAARVGGCSYRKLGDAIGGRDHNAVLHACDRAAQLYKANPEYRRRYDKLIRMASRWREANNDNDGPH